jgi:hypothetical protein
MKDKWKSAGKQVGRVATQMRERNKFNKKSFVIDN